MFAPTKQTTSPTARFGSAKRPGLLTLLKGLQALYRSRQALSRLSERELEDIGITASEARKEAGRHVWDVPQHWRL